MNGTYKPFRDVATGALDSLLAENGLESNREGITEVIQSFAALPAHPDVAEGIDLLRAAGVRVAALTNGSAETTRAMFASAGLKDAIEKFISIDAVKQWKPAAAVYQYAAQELDVKADELA